MSQIFPAFFVKKCYLLPQRVGFANNIRKFAYQDTMFMRALLSLFILSLFTCRSTDAYAQEYFSVMSYNVENVFDTIHDAGHTDDEFLPQGKQRWSGTRYRRKLRNVAKVIAAADTRKPVDIVGLCEVENDSVMAHLTQRTMLRRLGYEYVITNSAALRGIDVAIAYRPTTFRMLGHDSILAEGAATRDVLHAWGITNMEDTLDVYMVHLPSKLGGRKAGRLRTDMIGKIMLSVDSVMGVRPGTNIVVMGDFNDEMKHSEEFLSRRFTDLVKDKKPGTYKYKGTWSRIDHIFLRLANESLSAEAGILSLPFLLEEDKTHGGSKPFRTYYGPRYNGGISDHLPVWGVLRK